VSMGVPSRTSATTPALDQTFDFQIIPGKVRPFLRRLAEAHPQTSDSANCQAAAGSGARYGCPKALIGSKVWLVCRQ
jgi:hypothetical protein